MSYNNTIKIPREAGNEIKRTREDIEADIETYLNGGGEIASVQGAEVVDTFIAKRVYEQYYADDLVVQTVTGKWN